MKFLTTLFLILISYNVYAGEIVAVVNDEPISSYDAEARAKLIAIQRNQTLTNQRKSQYINQAIQALIDDKVKINEAKRNGFDVSDSEVNGAIAHLEKQNNMKSGQMTKTLSRNGIPVSILKNQIKADLMWVQVMQKHKNAIAIVSKEDIEKKKNAMRAELRREGFYVSEIIVPTKEAAEKCFEELNKGSSFSSIAKKYSTASSAKRGGEVGWIKPNQYTTEIRSVLRQMTVGELSVPLKTKNGYLLLLLQDRKYAIAGDSVPIWEVAQMAMPHENTQKKEADLAKIKTCSEFTAFSKKNGIPESIKSGMISPEQLPTELREILKKEPVKKLVGPIRTPEFDLFFMKCAVTEKRVLPSDDEIRSELGGDKMEDLSDRLLKNAKRYVVIERRK